MLAFLTMFASESSQEMTWPWAFVVVTPILAFLLLIGFMIWIDRND